MIFPRLALLGAAALAVYVARRRPDVRPLAYALLLLAALDCARLVTLPRALAGSVVSMRLDAAILAWWPVPVALLLLPRWWRVALAVGSVYAAAVALAHWQRWGVGALYLPALRAPRLALALVALLVAPTARRTLAGRVALLLAAGMAAGVVVDTWAAWESAQAALSAGVWVCAAGMVWWER